MKTRLAMPPCASIASPFPDLRRSELLQPMHTKPLKIMKAQFSTNGIFGLAVGVLLTGIAASATTNYVWQDSPSPAPPYATWATAAHTIQDAVDAAQDGDTLLVSGGVYDTGGRAVVDLMTNRVAIEKAIRVESLMGPEVTVIEGVTPLDGGTGNEAIRCAYVGTNAVLCGFTLTNGYALFSGMRGMAAERAKPYLPVAL